MYADNINSDTNQETPQNREEGIRKGKERNVEGKDNNNNGNRIN